jgi:hypothetical protein
MASIQQPIPFDVGVKSAGGGYHPKFKSGATVVAKQPEAQTPFAPTAYFTTTGMLRNKKKFIYEQPQFQNNRRDAWSNYPSRMPWDAYPATKPSWTGVHDSIDWKNPFADEYRETMNATQNRMIIDRQEKKDEIPKQWLNAADVKFDLEADLMYDYRRVVTENVIRDKVDKLKAMGYTDAEIGAALEKQRSKEIANVLNLPFRTTSAHQRVAALNSYFHRPAPVLSSPHGLTAVGATPASRSPAMAAAAAAGTTPVRRAHAPSRAMRSPPVSLATPQQGTPVSRTRSAGASPRLGTPLNPVPVPSGHTVTNAGIIQPETRGRKPRVSAQEALASVRRMAGNGQI